MHFDLSGFFLKFHSVDFEDAYSTSQSVISSSPATVLFSDDFFIYLAGGDTLVSPDLII